jgi:hypothetical protein
MRLRAHAGQGDRCHVAVEVVVVHAEDGQLLRHDDARQLGRAQAVPRAHVVACEHRAGPGQPAQRFSQPLVVGPIATGFEAHIEDLRHPFGRKRPGEPAQPFGRNGRPGDPHKGKVTVPALEKMPCRQRAAGGVVVVDPHHP